MIAVVVLRVSLSDAGIRSRYALTITVIVYCISANGTE